MRWLRTAKKRIRAVLVFRNRDNTEFIGVFAVVPVQVQATYKTIREGHFSKTINISHQSRVTSGHEATNEKDRRAGSIRPIQERHEVGFPPPHFEIKRRIEEQRKQSAMNPKHAGCRRQARLDDALCAGPEGKELIRIFPRRSVRARNETRNEN